MNTNINISQLSESIADTLQVLGSPARIAILIAIGQSEACVCHLEAILGWRQAYISQHLMALRRAGMLSDRRDGRYVYYRLKNEALLSLLNDTASLSGIPAGQLNTLTNPNPGPNCECPHCAPNLIPLERIEKL